MSFSDVSTDTVEASDLARGKLGAFETRLAHSIKEIKAAQALRYRVFCEELDAQVDSESSHSKLEGDAHDENCDHLLVLSDDNELIGTQRFMVREGSVGPKEFYSSSEFDIAAILQKFPTKKFMELGRSCILPDYRDKRTMELLWHATWDYAVKQRADVMFGCASFHTQDANEISDALGFLAQHAGVTGDWMVTSKRADRIDMLQYIDQSKPMKSAIRSLPPLIKGYLRLGAMFSTNAVPDPDFGTIDVLVVLPVETINPRYVKYYGANADRHRV